MKASKNGEFYYQLHTFQDMFNVSLKFMQALFEKRSVRSYFFSYHRCVIRQPATLIQYYAHGTLNKWISNEKSKMKKMKLLYVGARVHLQYPLSILETRARNCRKLSGDKYFQMSYHWNYHRIQLEINRLFLKPLFSNFI